MVKGREDENLMMGGGPIDEMGHKGVRRMGAGSSGSFLYSQLLGRLRSGRLQFQGSQGRNLARLSSQPTNWGLWCMPILSVNMGRRLWSLSAQEKI
jgi:hypothetical protein